MSDIFGVSTDYLLKGGESAGAVPPQDEPEREKEPEGRYVTMAEASKYINMKERSAWLYALTTATIHIAVARA